MRFAVIGAGGQLGRELCPRLPGPVTELGRADIDLAAPTTAEAVLEKVGADVVVNCAAFNFVDRAENEAALAFAVNAIGVEHLARVCHQQGRRFVHFSSDYIFGLDSRRGAPYAESDAPGPLSVYGVTKLAGEYLARAACPDSLIVRSCGLYGAWGSGGKGGNFVETMLRSAGHNRPIRVVNDQKCTPSYTVDVALAAVALINRGCTGIVHVTNAGSCSWFEFAREIFTLCSLDVDLQAIPTSEYPTAARRPAYSVLATDGLEALGIPRLRTWQSALAAYLTERKSRA